MSTNTSAKFSNYRWSANDEAVCYNLIQEGKTYDQIAKALGRSKRAVHNHVFLMREKRLKKGESIDDLFARPIRSKTRRPGQYKVSSIEAPQKNNIIPPIESINKVDAEPSIIVQQSNPEQNWQSTAIAIFTGGCFVTLVIMTVLLIAIS
tara:strand:+ start:1508 stop:1957 length:450 start_codon:yes stop_codon:yes gene_type:complete